MTAQHHVRCRPDHLERFTAPCLAQGRRESYWQPHSCYVFHKPIKPVCVWNGTKSQCKDSLPGCTKIRVTEAWREKTGWSDVCRHIMMTSWQPAMIICPNMLTYQKLGWRITPVIHANEHGDRCIQGLTLKVHRVVCVNVYWQNPNLWVSVTLR